MRIIICSFIFNLRMTTFRINSGILEAKDNRDSFYHMNKWNNWIFFKYRFHVLISWFHFFTSVKHAAFGVCLYDVYWLNKYCFVLCWYCLLKANIQSIFSNFHCWKHEKGIAKETQLKLTPLILYKNNSFKENRKYI